MTSNTAAAKEESARWLVGYERDGSFQAAECYVELEREEESRWKAVLHFGIDELPPIVVTARTDELALDLLEAEADRCLDAFRAGGGSTSSHVLCWGYEKQVRPVREELAYWRETRRLIHHPRPDARFTQVPSATAGGHVTCAVDVGGRQVVIHEAVGCAWELAPGQDGLSILERKALDRLFNEYREEDRQRHDELLLEAVRLWREAGGPPPWPRSDGQGIVITGPAKPWRGTRGAFLECGGELTGVRFVVFNDGACWEDFEGWQGDREDGTPERFNQLRYEVMCAGVGYCLDHAAELQELGVDMERFQKINW